MRRKSSGCQRVTMPRTHCRAIAHAGQDAIVACTLPQALRHAESLREGHKNTPTLTPDDSPASGAVDRPLTLTGGGWVQQERRQRMGNE